MEESMQKKVSKEYKRMVEEKSPNSELLKNCLYAFVIGGLISDVGQFFTNLVIYYGVPRDQSPAYVASIMVFDISTGETSLMKDFKG